MLFVSSVLFSECLMFSPFLKPSCVKPSARYTSENSLSWICCHSCFVGIEYCRKCFHLILQGSHYHSPSYKVWEIKGGGLRLMLARTFSCCHGTRNSSCAWPKTACYLIDRGMLSMHLDPASFCIVPPFRVLYGICYVGSGAFVIISRFVRLRYCMGYTSHPYKIAYYAKLRKMSVIIPYLHDSLWELIKIVRLIVD